MAPIEGGVNNKIDDVIVAHNGDQETSQIAEQNATEKTQSYKDNTNTVQETYILY